VAWEPIERSFERKLSARDKNVCPDCGEELERCEAWDISPDYIDQPDWIRAITNAKRCRDEECGFYYMRQGPAGFFMKPFGGRGLSELEFAGGMSMTKFRKKPVEIEATQWFKNGDHPEDKSEPVYSKDSEAFMSEGKVVRYYRRPDDDGQRKCEKCGEIMHVHGWIDTLEGGHIVCPGDWIITGVQGERYPCKPDVFEATYDLVE